MGAGPRPPPGSCSCPAAVGAAHARVAARSRRRCARRSVRGGSRPGTRLPSSRELAADLGVSRGLVTEAYEQLTAEGYLRSGRGAGTWVGGAVRAAAAPGARDLAPALRPAPGPTSCPAHRTCRCSRAPRGRPRSAGCSPNCRTTHWATRIRAACPGCVRPWPSSSPGAGAWSPIRSGSSSVSGVAQAMTLLGFVLHARGVRDRRRRGSRAAPSTARCSPRPASAPYRCPWTSEGLATGPLRDVGRTGGGDDAGPPVPLGDRVLRARAAPNSSTGHGRWTAWSIEDDYDGDFRYDRAPVGALQGLDPEHVAYTGSVSKSLAPGLRLGWLLVPGVAGRGGRRAQAHHGPRQPRRRPGAPGPLRRARRLRPAAAPLPARLPGAPRHPRGRPGGALSRARRCPGSRRVCTSSPRCPSGTGHRTASSSGPRRPGSPSARWRTTAPGRRRRTAYGWCSGTRTCPRRGSAEGVRLLARAAP